MAKRQVKQGQRAMQKINDQDTKIRPSTGTFIVNLKDSKTAREAETTSDVEI